ncbi:hypothetical protein REPUB_Repub04eG0005700 [Reevesia pubescens]
MAAYDHLIKLLLIGDSGVGKSCLLLRFADGSFTTSFITTIGIDFKIRTIELEGKRIKLQIWDTAGQQRFDQITTAYYRGAMGLLLVYDVTNETSFDNIRKRIRKIYDYASENAQIILIGNKADLDESERVVPRLRGQTLAGEYGIKFFETSSKSNLGVEEVFFTISKDILSEMEKEKEDRLLTEKALKRPVVNKTNESNEGTSEAKENPTATLLEHDEATTVIDSGIGPLVIFLTNGTPTEKKVAATALFNLSKLHENRVKIVQAGAVRHLLHLMDPAAGMVDEAAAVLSNLAKVPEGRSEISEGGGIPVLVEIVELGSEKGKENAVAALLQLCTSSSRYCNLTLQKGVIPPLVALTQFGTLRAKEKAKALLAYLRPQRAEITDYSSPNSPAKHQVSGLGEHTISVADSFRSSSFRSSPRGRENWEFAWPSFYLLDRANRSLYLSVGVPLYNASLSGDWETAKKLIYENYSDPRTILCYCITKQYETALHVAAGARQVAFVEELLKLMEPIDLELQDRMGNTAFCLAAAAGAVPIAKMLMEKNSDLLSITSSANITPLYIAAAFGHPEMAWFIYRQVRDDVRNLEGIFFRCIDTGLFGLALELLKKDPRLAMARNEYDETALHVLARKPSIFASKNPGTLKRLPRLIESCWGSKDHTSSMPNKALQLVTRLWKEVLNDQNWDIEVTINRPSILSFEAARVGNHKFLAELIRFYPDLIWEVNDANQTIFHIAVLHRHLSIFNQIYKIGSIKDEIVTYESTHGDNILHLAAKIPFSDRLNIVSGAALQMHRELLWFKEVKKITPLLLREKIGSEGLTPRELFNKEHKELLKDGEKWMKSTAQSCMIVATLITTVVFAAAFSIPGGNDDNGTPIRIKETMFHVFAVSNAMALSSSIASTLMFLYILTSRYREEDFEEALPFKLMAGLATLFISMIAMMVAFTAAFFLTYLHQKLRWVPFLASSFFFVPATLFVMLQSPLF